MINILKKIKNYILSFLSRSYEKCYLNSVNEGNAYDGRCGGLAGGTKATDYLSEHCVSCPYLKL